MKKIFILILLIALGFGVHANVSRAQTAPAPTIGPEQVKALSQALDALTALLKEMQLVVANPETPASYRAVIHTALTGIEGELAAITVAIGNRVALARAEAPPLAPVAVAAPQPASKEPEGTPLVSAGSAGGVRKDGEEMEKSEVAVLPITEEESVRSGRADIEEESGSAAVSTSVNPQNIVWIVLIVLAAIGAAFWWRRRGDMDELAAEPSTKKGKRSDSQDSEKRVQGIPSDY
ncbi:MAG: hypothetical protein HY435_03385 [Candidatus Liptonbacteria bacterium]|nr:hypothetical protein [Candidatus Liptonbacteria bacterium]